ncbi:MAG: CoA transferase [Deltaproteobacteria bacterium]|jgi:crotonobetainyl-CoA:carnitine CoA-transferase CaiB-like acyl-CoA transferase|nr:CoA transferase [Deltaproteobacteria bacterium]MBT6501723.1 CoA transferase [Deltaproteobacteria bacterium]
MKKAKGPLEGIQILDFTHMLSGPFGASMLGDLGADVIKIEPPKGDTVRMGPPKQGGEGAYFFSVNRNKKAISLDLKKPEALEIVYRLVKDADVVMENFRPGVMERLGLGYDKLKEINPELIYSSLTAFGRTGPYKDKPGFELIIQALTGLVDVTTPKGGEPQKIQIQIVDLCTGMFLAYATLAALYQKLDTGEGQRVDTSLLESTIALTTNLAGIYFMTGKVPTEMGSRNPQGMPSQVFRSKDSAFAMVGAAHWDRFCQALEKPEWIEDPKLSDISYRIDNYDDTVALVESITTTKTTAEWMPIFEKHQVAAAPVNTIEQGLEDPGVKATGIIKTVDHPTAGKIKLLDKPWQMSGVADSPCAAPPLLGEHNEDILKEVGFSDAEIDELKKNGIIFSRQ